MRRFLVNTLIIAIGLTSCAAKAPVSYKHGLTELKHDLSKAEKELSVAQKRVMKLEEAIALHEIRRIENEIGKIAAEEMAELLRTRKQRLAFFSNQRETLATIIHKYPECAFQAQAVLDEILTLITHISDEIVD